MNKMLRAVLRHEREGRIYDLFGFVLNQNPELVMARNSGGHITLEEDLIASQIRQILSYDGSRGFILKTDSEKGINGERADGSIFYLKKGETLVLNNGDRFDINPLGPFVYMEANNAR